MRAAGAVIGCVAALVAPLWGCGKQEEVVESSDVVDVLDLPGLGGITAEGEYVTAQTVTAEPVAGQSGDSVDTAGDGQSGDSVDAAGAGQGDTAAAQGPDGSGADGGQASEPMADDAASGDDSMTTAEIVANYLTQEQTLYLGNMTGKDLVELRVTIGQTTDVEVLGGERLRDGATASYVLPEELRGVTQEQWRLRVMAIASDDVRYDFPEVSVYDTTQIHAVLSTQGGEAVLEIE